MGADYVGWRGCSLQQDLGEEGFLGKLKLRGYRRVIEERVPPERRDVVRISVSVTGRGERELDHAGIVAELADFERGVADCATCPLASDGAPVSCYRYVTYPVDAASEEVVFDHFAARVAEPGSLSNQIWQGIVRHVKDDNAWHTHRGEGGALAEREEPLRARFIWEGEEQQVDSAQVLAGLFAALDEPATLVAYAVFFKEILAAWRARVGLRDDGSLEVRVDGEGADEAELARRAEAAVEAARALAAARTLSEIEDLTPMLLRAAAHAVDDGWRVLVDS